MKKFLSFSDFCAKKHRNIGEIFARFVNKKVTFRKH